MIIGLVTTWLVGIIIVVIGIINMSGNISSLHSYHRQRVKTEDVKPFGRLVGIGMLIIGIAIIVYGAMLLACELSGISSFLTVGMVVLTAGIIVGLVISFYAMKKYNGGIF